MPVPDKVILPLAVVIMALILSEVMVYAGVSVTLREPVNRFAEIASWLATTWLLLRVIDSIFTRAVNLSYRKNHTERVSILGLLRKVVKALLLIFAVIVIFGNLGFDLMYRYCCFRCGWFGVGTWCTKDHRKPRG